MIAGVLVIRDADCRPRGLQSAVAGTAVPVARGPANSAPAISAVTIRPMARLSWSFATKRRDAGDRGSPDGFDPHHGATRSADGRGPAAELDHDLRTAFGWLRRQREVLAVPVTGVALAMSDSAWFTLLVLYLRDALDLLGIWFGIMLAIGAVGGLTGGLLAARIVRAVGMRLTMTVSLLIAAAGSLLESPVTSWSPRSSCCQQSRLRRLERRPRRLPVGFTDCGVSQRWCRCWIGFP